MKPTKQPHHVRRAVGLAVFLCAAAVLLGLVAYLAWMRRSTVDEITRRERTRDKLRVIADRLATESTQAESDKRVVLNMLRQCRAAEDIPDLRTKRIFAQHQGYGKMCMVVPEGSHVLEISWTWKPRPTPEDVADVDAGSDASGPAGEETWNVPLLPASGYFLEAAGDRKGGPIHWELTSNHPEFEPQAERVPFAGFSHRGSSWSTTDVALFPNQIAPFSIARVKAAATSRPAGVSLMETSLNGPRDGIQYVVTFSVRLLSDGPACISASDARSVIILGHGDLLLPYKSDGKYEIRVSNPTGRVPE